MNRTVWRLDALLIVGLLVDLGLLLFVGSGHTITAATRPWVAQHLILARVLSIFIVLVLLLATDTARPCPRRCCDPLGLAILFLLVGGLVIHLAWWG